MDNRVSVREAAYILNTTEQFIRIALQRNMLPIGVCTQGGKTKRYSYYIYADKIGEYLHKDINIVQIRKEMKSKGIYKKESWCKFGEEI